MAVAFLDPFGLHENAVDSAEVKEFKFENLCTDKKLWVFSLMKQVKARVMEK